jgi:hypothetical protein
MYDKPGHEKVHVGPDLAQAMLDTQMFNRNLNPNIVAKYAHDMENGNWFYTGEAVKFGIDGTLKDGQHRLTAIVKSQMTVPVLVVGGLTPEAQDRMDSGRVRTFADVLSINGYTSSAVLAAVIKLAYLTVHGENEKPSRSDLENFLVNNPDLEEATSHSVRLRNHLPDFRSSTLGVAWWMLAQRDEAAAHRFFDGLANNQTSGAGDPRNALLHRIATMRRLRENMTAYEQLILVVRAWNAWRKGTTMTKMVSTSREGRIGMPAKVL